MATDLETRTVMPKANYSARRTVRSKESYWAMQMATPTAMNSDSMKVTMKAMYSGFPKAMLKGTPTDWRSDLRWVSS